MSSLEKELEVLNVYLFLLQTRHEESLIVDINIDKKFFQHFLPTLSLQMLVENAVKHNSFSHEEPLHINLYIESDYLVVKNKLHKKGASVQSTKVGLENIRNQYSLQSKKQVIVAYDEGYFTVKIPVLQTLRLS